MIQPIRLELPTCKAEYLLNDATQPGEGGNKQKFWQEVIPAEPQETGAFVERLGVETVYSHELTLVKTAS